MTHESAAASCRVTVFAGHTEDGARHGSQSVDEIWHERDFFRNSSSLASVAFILILSQRLKPIS
jgi:hypothetical protein